MTPDSENTHTLATTDDAFLGGALTILQPKKGYRAGIDAVLLAACADERSGQQQTILDMGAGVGTVGICAAHRLSTAQVTLVERQKDLVDLARRNIARNNLEDRVRSIQRDVLSKAQDADDLGLGAEIFDQVLTNPPFHDSRAGTSANTELKSQSHAMQPEDLDHWMRFATRVLKPGGRCTVIHKAQALDQLLAACRNRLGGLVVTTVHPRENEPAIRVLVSGKKGSRADMRILPPLILHAGPGRDFTNLLDAVLRQGSAYDLTGKSP